MAFEAPIVVVASAARTTTGNGSSVAVGGERRVSLTLDVTAASGTTPTLDVAVQWSADGGTTWVAAQPADSYTQVVATGSAVKVFDVKAPLYRIAWTIGGTTPSFTFSVRHYGIG